MFNDYSDVLSLNEVSELMGIGRTLTYKLVKSGLIRAFKCGRRWMVLKEAVINYMRLQSGF